MATNIPTYALNGTAVTARALEVPAASFDNLGSCSGGIGIATAVVDTNDKAFTEGTPTAAYQTQHIGGDGLDSGSTTTFAVETVQGVDVNDTVAYVQADASTAADAVLDITTGAINKTGATVAAGARVWGVIPVA